MSESTFEELPPPAAAAVADIDAAGAALPVASTTEDALPPFVVTPGQLCVFNMKTPCRDGDNCCLVHAEAGRVCDSYGFDGFCPDGANCTAGVHVAFMDCDSSKDMRVPEAERCQQRTKTSRWCLECRASYRRKPVAANSVGSSTSNSISNSTSDSTAAPQPPIRWRSDRYQAPAANQEPWHRVQQRRPPRGNNRTFHAPGRKPSVHAQAQQQQQQEQQQLISRGRDLRGAVPLIPQRPFQPVPPQPSLPRPPLSSAAPIASTASSSSTSTLPPTRTAHNSSNRFALPDAYSGAWADMVEDD
jgi:hypothetical protein